MTTGNTLHSAAFVSVLVFPLTAFVSAIFNGTEIVPLLTLLKNMDWPMIWQFGLVYLVPIIAGLYAKEVALNTYDKLDAKAKQNH